MAGDEVLRLLHHHAHLLEVEGGEAVETARVDDEPGRLGAEAGHAEQHLVIRRVDIHREDFGMPQRPCQLRVHLQVEVRVRIIHDLLHLEMVEPQQPVGLV